MLSTTKTSGRRTKGFSEERYAALLRDSRPRIITTEEENERALRLVDRLMKKKELSLEENTLYDLLIALITAFENKAYPIEELSAGETLRELMEARGLRQKDLEGVIGSKGVVSEIVNGKRSISKEQAKALGRLFDVSPALFI